MAKRKARAAKASKKATKRAAARRPGRVTKRAAARKATQKAKRAVRPVARKAAKKASARTSARKAATRKVARKERKAVRKGAPKKAFSAKAPSPTRKVPALNRARRTVQDDDVVPSPPSSLDLDRRASASRSGRKEMHERMDHLTQTGPALTGGDLDADWESAYSVGDEVPGGDNPTPDQDVVDEIGEALGLQYEDNEELKGESKITKRDSHRWELDPASSDDYNDR